MSKKKYSREFKLHIIREHESGKSLHSLEIEYDIVRGTARRWYAAYKSRGEDALEKKISVYCKYSASFKQ